MASLESMHKYIVGAYATSPNLFTWDEASETNYFNGLKKLQSIRGLELPFWGENLHPFDNQWLLSNLDPKWENVLTCIPGTMKQLESDFNFGLASKNEISRKNAINFYLRAFNCVDQLKNHFGDKSVIALFIASAPYINENHQNADKDCFISSLIELASWDRGETQIFIEHCDAYNIINSKPRKGFLSLSDEIDAVKQINEKHGSNFGIVINWGRSAIEHRNIDGPLKHVEKTTQHNVLRGLMFSGTTANENNLYGAWSDLHMPPADHSDFEYFEPESLMSYKNIKNTLAACNIGALNCLGIKLLAMPTDSDMKKRININRDAMILLDQAINEINRA